ncbi:MAG: glycosyltransferase [Elusimicrobia bacterium]|nr:glycosyltransferase [Elusimicrobiota bacterium]
MIDVCVSTHNNLPELPAVLDSIFSQRENFQGRVFVIDNGSTDGGPDWVRRNRPWVEVLEQGQNRGPCASRNAALREPGAEWVLLLDGDCSLAPKFAQALMRDRETNPAEVYSGRTVYAAEPDRIYYDAGSAHFLGLLCLENVQASSGRAFAPTREPGAVSTSALLVSREAARRAGFFDEGYFFFGEDLDFSLRLRALGFRLRHVPEAVVLHHKPLPGSEPAAAEDRRRSALRSQRQGPNRWRTLLKVCRGRTLLRAAPLHLAYQSIEGLNALREGNVTEHAGGWVRLAKDLHSVLSARRSVQASRSVEDAELFGNPALSWRPEILALPGAGLLKRLLELACAFSWSGQTSQSSLSLPRLLIARMRQFRLAARARRFAQTEPARIRRLILMLQSQCALRCRMCDLWLEPESSLPADRIPELLRAKCLAPGVSVHLTGGEPFLYPDFTVTYGRIRSLMPEAEMTIQSSGSPAGAILDFLRSDPDLRRTTLCFSFDGVGAHDFQRGRAGAEAELMSLLEKSRRMVPNARLLLRFTITPWNAGAVRSTFAMARELGVGIQFQMVDHNPQYTNSVRRPRNGTPFPFPPAALKTLGKDLRSVFNDLSVLRDRHEMGHLLRLIESLDDDGRIPCRRSCPVPSQSAFIRADGAVLTCRGRPPVGNALQDGLDAAWNSEAAAFLRRAGCGACEPRYNEF